MRGKSRAAVCTAERAAKLESAKTRKDSFRLTSLEQARLIAGLAQEKLAEDVVIIDLRPESETYTRWLGVELDADSGRALYVPKGFAHGYQTLVAESETFYLVSEYYTPEAEDGVRWDDPAFGIEWPDQANAFLSEKDRNWPDFTG